ncbi:MAG: hypothetical protein J6N15_04115 [Ruminiclostridium sp.]|nr:hypothetical protein [Ruminiclostridium sp.]
MSTITEVLVEIQKTVGEFAKEVERMRDSCESEETYQFYDGQLLAYNRVSAMLLKAALGVEENE